MTALTLEQDLAPAATFGRVAAPRRGAPSRVRPGRGTGRGVGPRSRPASPLAAPSMRRTGDVRGRACTVSAPSVPSSPAVWRLTDRGVAAILVVLASVVFAAVMVVGLTALQVTSPTYQVQGQSQLAQR